MICIGIILKNPQNCTSLAMPEHWLYLSCHSAQFIVFFPLRYLVQFWAFYFTSSLLQII